MTDTVLFLPSEPGGEVLLLRRTGDVGGEALRGAASELPAGTSPCVVLPGQSVRAFAVDLPARLKPADRLAAARFAQEDQISTDPSELHVVLGPGTPALMRVVDPQVMADAVAAHDPATVVADFDILAGLGDDPVALPDRVVVPGPEGYAVDPDWSDSMPTPLPMDALRDAVFARLDARDYPELRAGRFRRRAQVSLGRWAAVAATALLCAGLGLGLALADARAVQAQADTIREEARALYQQRTGQPAPARLSQLPSGAADDARFLRLSQSLFAATADHPEVEVERLSWEAREGVLRLRLAYPDFDAATALETSFAGGDTQFTTGGVREQNGRFVGDAVIALRGES